MKIPIICENDECVNQGSVINTVSGIPEEDLDLFYEDYDGSDESDICRFCGQAGVALNPIDENDECVNRGSSGIPELDKLLMVWSNVSEIGKGGKYIS